MNETDVSLETSKQKLGPFFNVRKIILDKLIILSSYMQSYQLAKLGVHKRYPDLNSLLTDN